MKKRVFFCALLMLMSCFTVAAQQAQQPLTFWYEYHVNPGKEDEFLNLVKTVGQPVRDKLMADGVVLAWGVEAPLLRIPDAATHMIWYTVADYAGVEKVDIAMREQIAKMTEEAAKGLVRKERGGSGWRSERTCEGNHRLWQDARLPDARPGDGFRYGESAGRNFAVCAVRLRESETWQGRGVPQGLGEVQQADLRQAGGRRDYPGVRPGGRRYPDRRRLHALHLDRDERLGIAGQSAGCRSGRP